MRKQKVAIIGAGPSGFAVAEVLRGDEFNNHFDFTIFERNNYVGGKCCTVLQDGSISNGQPKGYEMGAALVSQRSPSYEELDKIIAKYDIKMSRFGKEGSSPFRYMKNGTAISIKQFYFRQALTKPKKFWKAFSGFDEYFSDYIRHVHSKHAGYDRRPKELNKNTSKKYSRSVYLRFAGIVQGFGYADLDDKHLTPPALYYHQYIEPQVLEYPVHTIDIGTQGIWSKIAATYPAKSIRLNEGVTAVTRTNQGVIITTNKGTEKYDYLVVATPLKPALKFLDISDSDRSFFKKMKHNHYISVLCRVSGLDSIGNFNLPACSNKKHLGEVVFSYKRYPDSDYITAYMYAGQDQKSDDTTILNNLEKSLREDMNVQLLDNQKSKIFHWDDYFGHLGTKDLNSGWYDKFEQNIQGQNRTLFVSSGLHMETVGASVQYGTKYAKKYFKQHLKD